MLTQPHQDKWQDTIAVVCCLSQDLIILCLQLAVFSLLLKIYISQSLLLPGGPVAESRSKEWISNTNFVSRKVHCLSWRRILQKIMCISSYTIYSHLWNYPLTNASAKPCQYRSSRIQNQFFHWHQLSQYPGSNDFHFETKSWPYEVVGLWRYLCRHLLNVFSTYNEAVMPFA